METPFLIIGIAVIAAFVLGSSRPTPPPQIIYVQAETTESGALGCVPVILIGVALLVVFRNLQF
jgi:hypothetical protein